MRIVKSLFLLLSTTFVAVLANSNGGINVSVTLRGKKYELTDVKTVSDIQQNMEELSGLSAKKQSILHKSNKLNSNDVLEEVGVSDGDLINIISTSSKKKGSSSSSGSKVTNVSNTDDDSSNNDGLSGAANMMEEMMKQAGIDPEKLQEMLGGSGGGEGGMPDMMKSMEMMQEMVKSPLFKEFMNDPERLEQSRQMILQNPLMKSMMGSLPGFDEILGDAQKWRETMMAAAQMYESMGSDLMKAMADSMGGGMMNGMMGGGGMPGMPDLAGAGGWGMPDLGAASQNAFAGLDELSEGDE